MVVVLINQGMESLYTFQFDGVRKLNLKKAWTFL